MYHGIRQKIQYIYSNVTSIITFLIISWLCAAGAAIDDMQQGGLTRAQSGLRSSCPLVDSFLRPRSRPLVASILLIIMGLGQVVADNIAVLIRDEQTSSRYLKLDLIDTEMCIIHDVGVGGCF